MRKATVITTGSEIVEGLIINSNAQHICRRLTDMGVSVARSISVGDDLESIEKAICEAFEDSTVIIVSGGLGPTKDDLTREAVARSLNRKLLFDPALENRIKEKISKFHKTPASTRKQAMVIENAELIENPVGTAPGQLIRDGDVILILLPGPPQEMKPMLESVLSKLSDKRDCSINMLFFGISEASLDELVQKLPTPKWLKVATQATHTEGVKLRLHSPSEYSAELKKFSEQIITKISEHFVGFDNATLEEAVVRGLEASRLTVSSAESCTGGLLAAKIVSVPGASKVFKGAVVAYDNSVKTNILKVREQTIEQHGAVSEECVFEMAKKVRNMINSDLSVAISGIAGPSGGSESKPVGLAFICLWDGKKSYIKRMFYPQERNMFRSRVASTAMDMLRRYIFKLPVI
ncbi:MAG: competence/damage-inducible protein A [Thermotogae bacterium]|nr:MAG: competence/damage-inducible protein A [Thermotogota bacterium]